MTGTLVVKKARGHDEIAWDTEHARTGDPLDPSNAQSTFEEMMRSGGFAFAEAPGKPPEMIRGGEFDPETQSKVTVGPQIGGGQ